MNQGKKKLAFISQPEYFRFTYESDLNHLAEVKEFPLVPMLHQWDFTELIEYDADYNFFFRGEFIPADVLAKIPGVKIALSSEPFPRIINGRIEKTWDSVNRYLHFRSIRSLPYDYLFHYDDASLPVMAWDGIHCSGHFAFPVATEVYKHVSTERVWDLFFIGRSTDHRERFFSALKHKHHFLHICHGMWGPELVDYINQSAICLNVHAENEISWEPRVQMMLACGSLLISEKITPNEWLRPGIDYIEVTSPAEMHEAVSYYLAHPDEREKIAAEGRKRVSTLLDGKTQFMSLIERISQGEVPRFSTGVPSRLLNALDSTATTWRNGTRRLVSLFR
ncbi:glycosyltransferase [Zoogloea sp.]|uniref:glycosyltransferase family protein n=1 Tax=Zoogloea sp. TaxID=49181 RepID=UPI0026169EA2|nr:glycosyltransferase [Zoogloea sp.]MDD3354508.1 glycosyltransferase [Zoogloea sp.]